MMLSQLDGTVLALRRAGQLAIAEETRAARCYHGCVPFLRSELAKFLLQKGFNWKKEPAGRKATPTHVYVFDGDESRILRIDDLDDCDHIPIVRLFDAKAFSAEIDRMIDHGDAYMQAMGETFSLGMTESVRASHH